MMCQGLFSVSFLLCLLSFNVKDYFLFLFFPKANRKSCCARGLIDSLKIKDPGFGKKEFLRHKNLVWLFLVFFYGTFINGNLDFLWNLDWENLEPGEKQLFYLKKRIF